MFNVNIPAMVRYRDRNSISKLSIIARNINSKNDTSVKAVCIDGLKCLISTPQNIHNRSLYNSQLLSFPQI